MSRQVTSPEAVARALAQRFELPFIQLPDIPSQVSALVPIDFQCEHRIVPFRLEQEGRAERLLVAVADPEKLELIDELRFQLNKSIRVYVAAANDIDEALAALRGDAVEPLLDEDDGAESPVERTATPNAVGPSGQAQSAASGPAELPDEWTLAEPSAPEAPPPMPLAAPSSPSASLDELLGLGAPPPNPTAGSRPLFMVPSPASAGGAVTSPEAARVVHFGGAASSLPVPAPGTAGGPPQPPAPEFSEQDLKVLDTLEALSRGEAPLIEGEKVKPERLVATMLRLLLKKGVIQEQEFLEELARK